MNGRAPICNRIGGFRFKLCEVHQLLIIALSFNGRTTDSDSVNQGSNPCEATLWAVKVIGTPILDELL